MIAYSRGSERLAGAASLKHCMPAVLRTFYASDIAQWYEQQPHKLWVAGSIPAVRSGNSSVVEQQPRKLSVEGSNPSFLSPFDNGQSQLTS